MLTLPTLKSSMIYAAFVGTAGVCAYTGVGLLHSAANQGVSPTVQTSTPPNDQDTHSQDTPTAVLQLPATDDSTQQDFSPQTDEQPTADSPSVDNAALESDPAILDLILGDESEPGAEPESPSEPGESPDSDSEADTPRPAEQAPPQRNAPSISVNPAGAGGGGGGGGTGFGGGTGGGGGSGGGSAGSPTGLSAPSPDSPTPLNLNEEEQATIVALAAPTILEKTYTNRPKPTLITHPGALSEIELQTLINDIKTGAWTIAPDGRKDETSRLKNAFDAGGDIVLQAGDWPTQPVQVTVDGTRIVVEDGAKLNLLYTGDLTSVIEIEADNCVIIGLNADGGGENQPRHNGRHETILVTGNLNRLINCTSYGSGRIRSKVWFSQSGFAVYGDQNLLENCVSHDAAYGGIVNVGDDNYFRACKAYNYYYKGFNQGHNGRDLQRVTIEDWYAESDRGNGRTDRAAGGIYPVGLQLDTGERQLGEALLSDIHIGPHPDGIGGAKIATTEKVTVNDINIEDSEGFINASLILAEGLGTVTINGGTLRRGITQYPPKNSERPLIDKLEVIGVTLGNDQPINTYALHSHLLVKELVYRDCEFKGIGRTAFVAETPNDDIKSWLIEQCTFTSGLERGKTSHVMIPILSKDPPFESLTLNQSGKLVFLNNTLDAPEGTEMLLSDQPFFGQLLQTANNTGTRFRFDQIPSDPRITWQTGDTATIGNIVGDWVCLEGGAPGIWAAASWD